MSEKKLNESLNTLLADYHVFYQKLRNFHWNVKGENFFFLHEKFEELYNEVVVQIDELAERILSRGYTPLSTLKDYLEISRLEEAPTNLGDRDMVANLFGDIKGLVEYQRKVVEEFTEVDDMATANLVEDFADGQEKTAWMLGAFLGNETK